MGSVSLKDLMSPMLKIEKSLENIEDTSKNIFAAITRCENKLSYLESITAQLNNISTTLTSLLKKGSGANLFQGKENKSIKEGLSVLNALGVGVKSYSSGLLMFAFVPKNVSTKLANSITAVINSLTDVNDIEKAEKSAKILGDIGESILIFYKNIAKSAPLLLLDIAIIPLATAELNLFIKLLSKDINKKDVADSIKNIALIGDVGKGVISFFGLITLALPVIITGTFILPLMAAGLHAFTKIISTDDTDNIKESINVSLLLSKSAKSIFAFFSLVTLSAPFVIVGTAIIPLVAFGINMFVNSLSNNISDKKSKSLLENAVLLGKVGLSLFAFFGLITLSAPLIAANMILIPLAALEIKIFIESISNNNKDITEGIQNSLKLGLLGLNLLAFMGTALMAGIIAVPLMVTLPAMWLTMFVVSKMFSLYGGRSGVKIRQGAAVAGLVSLSLLGFGASLLLFYTMLQPFYKKPINILTTSAVLLAIGGVFALAGLAATPIALGALAMTAVSIPLILLSVGLNFISKSIKNFDKKTTNQLNDLLIGIGLTFAGAGLLAPMIILGAASMTAAGFSMILISTSILIYSSAIKNVKDSKKLFEDLSFGIKSVGKSFAAIGIMSIPLIAGAASMIVASLSLSMLSLGLKSFKKVGWDPNKGGDGDALTNALQSIRAAFLGVNKSDKEGFFKKLGGVITSGVDAVRMIEAAGAYITAGNALILLTAGLRKMKNLQWTEEDSIALTESLTSVSSSFAQVGDINGVIVNNSINDLFARWIGAYSIDKSAVQKGIATVNGAGKAIKDISKGLTDFTKWYKENENEIDISNENSLFYVALRTTITAVGSAFASIAGDTNQVNKYFGAFKWNKSKVKEGIQSVKGAGDSLTSISNGIIKFTEWYENNKNKIDINNENSPFFAALRTTITAVGGAFASIGKEKGEGKFACFSWSINYAKKGIKAVKDVEDALTGLTNGLIAFTDFYNQHKSELEGGLLTMLENSVTTVGSVFAAIGGSNNKYKKFSWNAKDVKRGIAAVEDVQVAIKNVIDGTLIFVKSGISSANVKLLSTLLLSMGKAFSTLSKVNMRVQGRNFQSFSTSVRAGLDTIYKTQDTTKRFNTINTVLITLEKQVRLNTFSNAAKGINQIAKAINTIDVEKGTAFSDLFVAASKLKDNTKFYQDLAKAVEDIRKMLEQRGISPAPTQTVQQSNTASTRTVQQPQQPQRQQPAQSSAPRKINTQKVEITAGSIYLNGTEIYSS